MELILTIVERQDSKAIGLGIRPDHSIGRVVGNVIFPSKLVEKVVCAGMGMEMVVAVKCLELFGLLVNNSEQFLSTMMNNTKSQLLSKV